MPANADVGVVIGRFQVPNFHAGHRHILDLVRARHRRVLILLGSPAWRGGKADPLDYCTRELMFRIEYPDFVVAAITDAQTDEIWSEAVDARIKDIFPLANVTLYGARDSFIPHYKGRYKTVWVPQALESSGTDDREQASALPLSETSFRAGAIYGISNNPSRMAPCVDGAVLHVGNKGIVSVCLIQKPGERFWRFPGGKLEANDHSLESAVNREVREETGLEVGAPVYVASGNLPDWRAVGAGITIHSALFALPYIFGAPRGGDDAAVAKFFALEPLERQDMEVCHKDLLDLLKNWVYGLSIGKSFIAGITPQHPGNTKGEPSEVEPASSN